MTTGLPFHLNRKTNRDQDTQNLRSAFVGFVRASAGFSIAVSVIIFSMLLFLVAPEAHGQSDADLVSTAFSLYKQQRPGEANSLLDQALKLNPDSADAHYLRGLILFHSFGKLKEAKEELDRAIALNSQFAVAYAERAAINNKQMNLLDALSDLSQAIKLRPDVASIYESRGVIYTNIGKYKEALQDLNRCLELKADQQEVLKIRGYAHSKLGNWKEALIDLDKGIAMKPDAKCIAGRAWVYYKTGKYQQALADCNHSIKLDPGFWTGYQVKGYILEALNKPEEALTNLNTSLRLNPKSGDSMEWRALCYQDLKQYDKALAEYTNALKYNPEFPSRIYQRRGLLYKQLKEYTKAVADFNSALKIKPESREELLLRARTFLASGDLTRALADYQDLLKKNPLDREALLERPGCYTGSDANQKALADYSLYLKSKPKDRYALLLRARTYRRLGDDNKALSDYSSIIALSPDDTEAFAARAEIYYEHGQLNSAIQEESNLIKRLPNSSRPWRRRGYYKYLQQRYSEALQDHNVALSLAPGDPDLLMSRVLVLNSIGEFKQAVDDCNKVLEKEKGKTDEHAKTLILRATVRKAKALCQMGECLDAAKILKETLDNDSEMLEKISELANVEQSYRNTKHYLSTIEREKTCADFRADTAQDLDEIDSAFSNKSATKHFLLLSNQNSLKTAYYAQFCEAFRSYIFKDLITLKNPEQAQRKVYLFANREELEKFAQKQKLSHTYFDADYWEARNAFLTHCDQSFAPLAYELVHRAMKENLTELEAWAENGIPDLFMKFYAYFDGAELHAYCGYENSWSLAALLSNPTALRISEILAIKSNKEQDPRCRLLAVFLQLNKKLEAYLKALQTGDKGSFNTYFEAAFAEKLREIEPAWIRHLQWNLRNLRELIFLPASEVFDNKEDLDEFMKKHQVPLPGEIVLPEMGVPSGKPVARLSGIKTEVA